MSKIDLPAHCDRSSASALLPEFTEAVGDTPIAVNASNVERLGLAVLALLVSAEQSGAGITLLNPSQSCRDALELAGLNALLADDGDLE